MKLGILSPPLHQVYAKAAESDLKADSSTIAKTERERAGERDGDESACDHTYETVVQQPQPPMRRHLLSNTVRATPCRTRGTSIWPGKLSTGETGCLVKPPVRNRCWDGETTHACLG